MDWKILLYLAGAGLMVWIAMRMVRGNPQMFSKENLGKSFYTVGLMTLLVIGVIAFCVMILRS